MSSSTSYPFSAFQKLPEFLSFFLSCYFIQRSLPSFLPSPLKFWSLLSTFQQNWAIMYNLPYHAEPWIVCVERERDGDIWTNKRFYFAWKLGRLSCASFQTQLILGLFCTEGWFKELHLLLEMLELLFLPLFFLALSLTTFIIVYFATIRSLLLTFLLFVFKENSQWK